MPQFDFFKTTLGIILLLLNMVVSVLAATLLQAETTSDFISRLGFPIFIAVILLSGIAIAIRLGWKYFTDKETAKDILVKSLYEMQQKTYETHNQNIVQMLNHRSEDMAKVGEMIQASTRSIEANTRASDANAQAIREIVKELERGHH